MKEGHTSVLMNEVIESLSLNAGDTVVDATLGGAGHFAKILGALGKDGMLVGIDADIDAIGRAKETVAKDARAEKPTVHIVEDNFRNLATIAGSLGITSIDKALFDLGWSGFHLTSGRGFSFQVDEPLYMTYGNPETAEQTAAHLVNTLREEELADIIYTYGEESFSRQIARSIVTARKTKRITTTAMLVEAILAGTPAWYHRGRINPATKTFQALRIATNDELGSLREGLASALNLLAPGGRVAVITFHSIEDRVVKAFFRDGADRGEGVLVSKKPIAPSPAELSANPRARSAKLRVFEKGMIAPAKGSATGVFYANNKTLI